MNDILVTSSKQRNSRIIIVAAAVVALLFGWVAISRQLGNMFAEMTSVNDPNASDVADLARSMAPSDPLGMWLKASLERSVFTPERTEASVLMFEQTVRLAPRDYRWWIELGRAYEQAEKIDRAEIALRHAVDMAPTYNYPRWQIGNFYLRQRRPEEAFAELKLATLNNFAYREQVFSLAWDYFDKDPAKVEQLAVDQPDVYASLALFYAVRGRAADSLRIWNKISADQKSSYLQIVKVMTQGLYDKRFYRQALEFAKDTGVDNDALPESVTNGGFESGIGNSDDTYFGWRLSRGDGKLDVASDSSVKHAGGRSLRIAFRGYAKAELYNIFQTVVVEPGKNYKLRYWLRTENLKSGGGPQLEIVNGNDDKIITTSRPFPQATNDWQEMALDFTAPENCEGIGIRTTRAFCGENCPIIGMVWYDDFELIKQ